MVETNPIDRQVCFVRLQADNFRLFFVNNGQTTEFRLHDEQMVNE
jgi:hypothetical protein